jgi:D123
MGYFDQVLPTYLENWPTELAKRSVRQAGLTLSVEEAAALGTNIVELFECFEQPWARDITSIHERLAGLFRNFPGGAFVRLGSRSPKDALYRKHKSLRVYNADDALSLLLGASERIMDDLLLAIAKNYRPSIFVREWLDTPPWTEFRCFMKQRTLVGISQYFYRTAYPPLLAGASEIEAAIRDFFPVFEETCHIQDVVFDVVVQPSASWEVTLVEINPYFELTDPCLFHW